VQELIGTVPFLHSVRSFIELGGDVLLLIAALSLLMWVLIFERVIYLWRAHPRAVREALALWEARGERSSWHAHRIRERLISVVTQGLERNLPLIKTCVALCPLLGLLGTVTGMVEVFEVMAISGSGNPRSMAAGVSKATVPTMAGMVAALSGLAVSVYLQKKAGRERKLLGEHMTMDH
jgi:biopolymer transport protein ExbB